MNRAASAAALFALRYCFPVSGPGAAQHLQHRFRRDISGYKRFANATGQDKPQLTGNNFFVLPHQSDQRVGIWQIALNIRQIGFHSHGFQMGPIVGQVLADLILNGQSRFGLSAFRINRYDRKVL